MERWAFFSTALDYRFGPQPSSDIELFGGSALYRGLDDLSILEYRMWTSADEVWARVCGIMDPESLGLWAFQFSNGTEGTEDLIEAYSEWAQRPDDEERANRLLLGLVIWHQCTYSPNGLYVRYEV